MRAAEDPCRVVAILARSPLPGRPVKTRMQPALTAEQCLELHVAMTGQVVANAAATGFHVELWLDGEPGAFAGLAARGSCAIRRQCGGDLGARMSNIAGDAVAAGQHIVLLGGDCPLLGTDRIDAMFASLANDADAVIVPASDGGYVALALRRFSEVIMTGKHWGGGDVAAATIDDFQRLGWCFDVGTPLADIDRPEDLAQLSAIPALARFAGWAR